MLRRPDIIVVGTGRSGTSAVARILQNDFDITMAIEYGTGPHNPLGDYEDKTMLEHSRFLTEKPGYTTSDWLEVYSRRFGKQPAFVGLKCCQLSLLGYLAWEQLAPKLVIRTYRPMEPTVASMLRWREPKSIPYWIDYYEKREACMQKHLDAEHTFPVLRINFEKEPKLDGFIKGTLYQWMKRLRNGTL